MHHRDQPLIAMRRMTTNWAFATSPLVAAAMAVALMATPGLAQRCNPATDGTYCYELPKVKIDLSTPPPTSDFGRMQSVGSDFSAGRDQPGTLGAISFRDDGTKCVGLFRRSSCN